MSSIAKEESQIRAGTHPDNPHRHQKTSHQQSHGAGRPSKKKKIIIKVLKFLFFVVNFILFLLGIVLLAVGAWAYTNQSYLGELVNIKIFRAITIVFIVCGIILILFSTLGCCGASNKIKIMVLLYYSVLLILFVIVLIGGIVIFKFRIEFEAQLKESLVQKMSLYLTKKTVTEAWDSLQHNLQCCGVATGAYTIGWKAWAGLNPKSFRGSSLVPHSCCRKIPGKKATLDCVAAPNDDTTYINNCDKQLRNYFIKHSATIAGIGIAVACVMLFGLTLSCVFILEL